VPIFLFYYNHNKLASHSVGGFGYILPVEHCDYKVPTKSCVPGLLGGLALIWENPASGAGISEIKRLSICDRKENAHI